MNIEGLYICSEKQGYSRIDWKRVRSCSLEVKNSLIPFLKKLKFCQEIYLKKPCLSNLKWLFEAFLDEEYKYERMAILLMIESVNPEVIYGILYNYIESSNLSDMKYLEYVIFISFFTGLLFDDMKVFEGGLLSYFGCDFVGILFDDNN